MILGGSRASVSRFQLGNVELRHLQHGLHHAIGLDGIYAAPRSWTEKAYPKLIHYNRLPKGGHFAAWEQPELFSTELRAAFRTLR